MPKIPIALQLYTVRDEAARDFPGTLHRVAEIGYAGVELAGYHGLSVRDLKGRLDDRHLSVAGSHIRLERLENELAQVVDENLTLGNRFIVVPSLPEDQRTVDGYFRSAERLDSLGDSLKSFGLTLVYHNHDFEFQILENGKRGLDILLENTDATLVKLELDAYWAVKAGIDPVAYAQQHTGRIPLMHLKDRDTSDGSDAPLGTGDLPLDDLVAAAETIGTNSLIVEQDTCKQPSLDASKISYEALKAKGYA